MLFTQAGKLKKSPSNGNRNRITVEIESKRTQQQNVCSNFYEINTKTNRFNSTNRNRLKQYEGILCRMAFQIV